MLYGGEVLYVWSMGVPECEAVGEWGPVCPCSDVCSEGSAGAQLTVCESHAPSTAVQWIQEELLRNVTDIRDATDFRPRMQPHSSMRDIY